MDYLDKFNQTFREFADDVLKVFPHDDEFRMYNLALNAAVLLKPDIVINVFHEKVIVPFGDRILAKDETFFLNHEYDDVKNENEDASALIDKIKNYWVDMSPDDREVVWKYFRVLVHLGRKIRT